MKSFTGAEYFSLLPVVFNRQDVTIMDFRIRIAALKEKPIIHSMLQSCLTGLSRFPDEIIDYRNENGIYHYPYLDAYWQEDVRFPYLLYGDSQLAGFALIRKDTDHWEMCEYYVKPEFRRRGLAKSCAAMIFQRHTGFWRISFNRHNIAGHSLWKKLAERLSKEAVIIGKTDTGHDYLSFSI